MSLRVCWWPTDQIPGQKQFYSSVCLTGKQVILTKVTHTHTHTPSIISRKQRTFQRWRPVQPLKATIKTMEWLITTACSWLKWSRWSFGRVGRGSPTGRGTGGDLNQNLSGLCISNKLISAFWLQQPSQGKSARRLCVIGREQRTVFRLTEWRIGFGYFNGKDSKNWKLKT